MEKIGSVAAQAQFLFLVTDKNPDPSKVALIMEDKLPIPVLNQQVASNATGECKLMFANYEDPSSLVMLAVRTLFAFSI